MAEKPAAVHKEELERLFTTALSKNNFSLSTIHFVGQMKFPSLYYGNLEGVIVTYIQSVGNCW